MTKPSMTEIDDNPEWTEADILRARRIGALPPGLRAKLPARGRGVQKTPLKERITIRLSPEVLEEFRATGPGWQTRIDGALKEWLKTHSPTG